ncbi:hypothetical protein S7S_07525 [Isoalcanivorax pacificus W11-5]|uniref:Uncharacterized protein n=1 Tax=Isoalcanivorax pacificus W11-5 TaxID=391936 RepID=A0A0B4XLC0_9GAMM|nr:hypothetical protein [Isoalcanivorax pacificus]AJD47921.1 hypothetical protein S7S_07525 [Isoalcanivorax pacificus W11-5]
MADIHIDDFCRDAALILLHLYNAFPRPQAIYVEDISGPDEPDEVGLHSKRYMACLGTLLWLASEGYLRYDSLIYQDGIDQAVLTNKAFVLLSAASDLRLAEPPANLPGTLMAEKGALVEQIRAALRGGHSADISAVMRYFLANRPEAVTSPATLPHYQRQPRDD